MINSKEYWENFYKDENVTLRPSSFAVFCMKYLDYKESILDFGCGNGRDSIYFVNQGIYVIAVDWIRNNYLSYLASINKSLKVIWKDIDSAVKDIDTADNLYMRFFLHAISDGDQTTILNWATKATQKKIFIEARSIVEPVGKLISNNIYNTDHSRRFINKNELEHKLKAIGFDIIHSEESKGLSKQGNSNPVLIRLVAQRHTNLQ